MKKKGQRYFFEKFNIMGKTSARLMKRMKPSDHYYQEGKSTYF